MSGFPGDLLGLLVGLLLMLWIAWVKLLPPKVGRHEHSRQPADEWDQPIPKEALSMAHVLVVTIPGVQRATRRAIRWGVKTLALAFVTMIALFILINALLKLLA